MTQLLPMISSANRIIRPSVLALSLAMTACSAQHSQRHDTASADLLNALELYRNGESQNAEPMLKAIYNAAASPVADQRRALAAAILIQLERNTPSALDNAWGLLDRYTALNSGPIEPEFYLLRESLNRALAASRASLNEHEAFQAAQRKLDAAHNERRQLEDTLKKLRKLSLE